MKQLIMALVLGCLMIPSMMQAQNDTRTDGIALCKENYTALFGGEALTGKGTDPEFMSILQKFIFGEVFAVGELDYKTRELITCTVLTTMQTLPQLKSHAEAALNVGVTPVELREAVYQCAPFIGFPRTLNAIGIINEVFREKAFLCHWMPRVLPQRRIDMKKDLLSKIHFTGMRLPNGWRMSRAVWGLMWPVF